MTFIKTLLGTVVLFLVTQLATAQDTIFLPSTLKNKETLKEKPKKDTVLIIKKQLVRKSKSISNNIEIVEKKEERIDTTQISLKNNAVNKNLREIKGGTNFKTKLQDYAVLKEFEEKWKRELINHGLYDSIQTMVEYEPYTGITYQANLTTEELKTDLKKLNARTPFNVEYNPALENVIRNFLKNRHQSMERLMSLSNYYFPLFEEVLDKYDLPLEIKYLAIVESALKPRAKSRVGATGLWQFMFSTGKMYGLDVSSYVDERMDTIKATNASAKYLSKLFEIFGDWDLALAAYNSGPGNVSKAIRRSGGYTNYWNIRPFLPRETAGYLPAFLATMYIFEFANKHEFNPKRTNFKFFETDTIQVKKQISLDQVAEVLDEEIETLQFLNPQYKLDIIPYIEDEAYSLRLPYDKIASFVANETAIYAKATEEFNKKEKVLPQFFEMDRKIKYRIRNGDYLGLIARKFGVRVSSIKKWNGLRNNNIRVGRYLSIYPRRIPKNVSGISRSNQINKPKSLKGTYIVKSGDSFWKISKKIGASVENLKKWNRISSNSLKPGMYLKIKK